MSISRNHSPRQGEHQFRARSATEPTSQRHSGRLEVSGFLCRHKHVEESVGIMRGGGTLERGVPVDLAEEANERWQAALPSETHHACISVVGISSVHLPRSDGSLARGAGKSCLCSRFVHCSHDDYWAMKEDHTSCRSREEFQDAEHCGSHSTYFGCVVKSVPKTGAGSCGASSPKQNSASSDAGCYDNVAFHVVEHTTFVDQESQMPFQGGDECLYTARATSPSLPVIRQHAYIGRRFSGLQMDKRERLPPIFNGLRSFVSGYLLVLDVCRCTEEIRQQLDALEDALLSISAQRLPHRVAVALTKCDAVSAVRLHELHELVSSRLVTVAIFEVSARRGVGIDAPFFYLYRSAQSGRSLDHSQWSIPYSVSLEAKSLISSRMERNLRKALATHVTDFHTTYESLVSGPNLHLEDSTCCEYPFPAVLSLLGRERCKALLRDQLVQLKTADLCERYQQELSEALGHHPDFSKDETCDLPKIQAVEVSAPNGTHGTDKADMAESDAVVDPTVARVARLYYESAMVDLLGVFWDMSSVDFGDHRLPPLMSPWLYNGCVQRSKTLLRSLTGTCHYPSPQEMSLYGASPPLMRIPRAVSLHNIAAPKPPASSYTPGAKLYEEVAEVPSEARSIQEEQKPALPPPRKQGVALARLIPSASCMNIPLTTEQQDSHRRRYESESAAKKRSKSPGFSFRKNSKKSAGQDRFNPVHPLITRGTTSPESHFRKPFTKSDESLLSSPPVTQCNSPFGGSPVFMSPVDTKPSSHSPIIDNMRRYNHSRSNSTPVPPLLGHNASLATGSAPSSTSTASNDVNMLEDGYLAPTEVRRIHPQAMMSQAISPANIHTDTGGHSTLPRRTRGSSTQEEEPPLRQVRLRSNSFGARGRRSSEGRQNQAPPGHYARTSGSLQEPWMILGSRPIVPIVPNNGISSPLNPVFLDDDHKTAGSEDSGEGTDHVSDDNDSPMPVKINFNRLCIRRDSLEQSGYQPVDIESYQFKPISVPPRSPPVFEHCDANEELARITDDRMAGLGIQPRSNVQSPAGVRPQSDMSRSTEVTDV